MHVLGGQVAKNEIIPTYTQANPTKIFEVSWFVLNWSCGLVANRALCGSRQATTQSIPSKNHIYFTLLTRKVRVVIQDLFEGMEEDDQE